MWQRTSSFLTTNKKYPADEQPRADDASKEKASYFEIAENIKSGELIGIKRDLETLKYEISQGMGFGGE